MTGAEQPGCDRYEALLQAGERLIAAQEEEHRLRSAVAKHHDMAEHAELVSAARKRVDEYAEAYCRMLDECGYPDLPIRRVIECGNRTGLQRH